MFDKIATQTVVSSHLVDNNIRKIAHASIKIMTQNWRRKTKKVLLYVCPKTSMIFVHASLHQKRNFLSLFACHIHQPSHYSNKKIDNE